MAVSRHDYKIAGLIQPFPKLHESRAKGLRLDPYLPINTDKPVSPRLELVQHLLSTELVEKIYQNVANEEGVPVETVRIKYTGKILNKSDSIGYKGICRETILKAEIITPKDITVTIQHADGHTFTLTLKNTDTVLKLKQGIYSHERCAISEQCLLYGGRALSSNTQSLLDAGVTPEAVIHLSKREAAAASPVESNVTDEETSDETKEALLNSFSTDGRPVEVVFSFDTTGSMFSCLTQVRTKLREACTRLLRDIPNVRIGIIAQGDYCDQDSSYVIRSLDLTTDVDRLCDFADNVPSSGGGDTPECYEWVLHKSQQLDWSDEAAKALVVIGDCEPHPPSYTDQLINWHQELDVLVGMGIKVYGVQAMNNKHVKPFYEELAERSGGCYINFKHFNLITDMFLAVCYKESSAEQLEAFCEEVRGDGRMTEETQAMFSQLEQKTAPDSTAKNDQSSRYVAKPWWDPQMSSDASPQYSYVQETDRWEAIVSHKLRESLSDCCPMPVAVPSPRSTYSGSKTSSPVKVKRCKTWKKRGCDVM